MNKKGNNQYKYQETIKWNFIPAKDIENNEYDFECIEWEFFDKSGLIYMHTTEENKKDILQSIISILEHEHVKELEAIKEKYKENCKQSLLEKIVNFIF